MEDNNWYEGIEKEISSLKEKMSKSDHKLYGVDLLLRIAKRVDSLSSDCEYCQGHRNDISNLVTDLDNLSDITKEEVSDYDRTFRSLVGHLEKRHGLHRIVPTTPYILIPLGIAVLLAGISYAMTLSASGKVDDTIGWLGVGGLFVAAAIFIAGVILGIIRLFRKPI